MGGQLCVVGYSCCVADVYRYFPPQEVYLKPLYQECTLCECSSRLMVDLVGIAIEMRLQQRSEGAQKGPNAINASEGRQYNYRGKCGGGRWGTAALRVVTQE